MSSTQQVESTRWTAEQLEKLVLQAEPKIAIFDCDGTLWNGDSGYGFMVWSLEQGLVSRSTTDWMDTRYRAYVAGKVSELQICGEMVQIYSGLREQELRKAAASYFNEHVQPHIFAEVAALVAKLRNANVELWAVSSTNKWVVSEGVRSFGIPEERVLAAEVKVLDGLITAELVDVPTGPAKATALRRVGIPRPDAVFGNSLHDLAMLEIAANAFPVNPSSALLTECAKRGWGYFRPREAAEAPPVIAGE
ncbi:haloacid dehalogenase-like hydrolase [Telmatobacter sp. DSM 110680]|uniref:Haloacid dehalogenase-like hydrolase n=1 Tax=Telmatobacter sp. DSM 110680 TaxID=3036704 RepID=A0AAU7DGS8_9BACT